MLSFRSARLEKQATCPFQHLLYLISLSCVLSSLLSLIRHLIRSFLLGCQVHCRLREEALSLVQSLLATKPVRDCPTGFPTYNPKSTSVQKGKESEQPITSPSFSRLLDMNIIRKESFCTLHTFHEFFRPDQISRSPPLGHKYPVLESCISSVNLDVGGSLLTMSSPRLLLTRCTVQPNLGSARGLLPVMGGRAQAVSFCIQAASSPKCPTAAPHVLLCSLAQHVFQRGQQHAEGEVAVSQTPQRSCSHFPRGPASGTIVGGSPGPEIPDACFLM